MSKEEQIIEIKECIDRVYGADCAYFDVDGFAIANEIYNAGYCKRSEGEWIRDSHREESYCSICGGISPVDCEKELFYESNFCPNCGANMKGGAE